MNRSGEDRENTGKVGVENVNRTSPQTPLREKAKRRCDVGACEKDTRRKSQNPAGPGSREEKGGSGKKRARANE